MKGNLLIFNTSSVLEAVKLNHKLMGRIISSKRNGEMKRYYRAGALDKIPHKRLIGGCYFSKGEVLMEAPNLIKIKCDLQVYDRDLKTARGYWKQHAKRKGIEVRNL